MTLRFGLATYAFVANLVLCCLQFVKADTETYWGDRDINVCTRVYCQDREPESYSGYEIELFRRTVPLLGWDPKRFNWSCRGWNEMNDALAAGDGRCDIAVAGVTISTQRLEAGLTFTWPTLKGGMRIMVLADPSTTNYWAFLDAFSWELWLAIVLTCFVVACILWAVERWALFGERHQGGPALPTLEQNVWMALGRPMQTRDMVSQSFAGNLIIVIFAFMTLILVAIYTGNTAANLTASRLRNTIRGVSDLPGVAVGTYEGMAVQLQKRGITAIEFPWNNVLDEEAMFDALRSGEIRALVLDADVLEYSAATRCDLMVVGDEFDQFDQGIAFPADFDTTELIKEYNKALVSLQQSGDMEALVNQYVNPPQATCKTSGVSEESTKVSFQQVSGLWILLAASVGVACLLAAIHQATVLSARRVAKTKLYQASMARIRDSTSRSLTRLATTGAWLNFSSSRQRRRDTAAAGAGANGRRPSSGCLSPMTTKDGGDSLDSEAKAGRGAMGSAVGPEALGTGPFLTAGIESARAGNQGERQAASLADLEAAVRRIERLLLQQQQQQRVGL